MAEAVRGVRAGRVRGGRDSEPPSLALHILELQISPVGAEIDIGAGARGPADGGTVRVEFHDTGRGIEPGGAERFFEPFFTTKEGGTGLGLAIANKIVAAHGGSIAFRNAENRGAVFAIALPVGRPAQSRVDDDVYVATLE